VKLWRDRSGQGVLEYGLILGLIAMVAIGALMVVGSSSNTSLARAGASLGGSASSAPQRAAGFGAIP
jgi:Flp pilus assembly pilin Flp